MISIETEKQKIKIRKKSISPVSARGLSRLCAVQVLYQHEYVAQEVELMTHRFIEEHFNYYKRCFGVRPDQQFFIDLVQYAVVNAACIDGHIVDNLKKGSSFDRMTLVIRQILRVGFSEITLYPNTPLPIIIDECIRITGQFFDENQINFINALLSQIGKKVR